MPGHTPENPRHPLSGGVPAALLLARQQLRDRLFPEVEAGIRLAMVARSAGRFEPAPEVNLVGVGIGEKVAAGRRTGDLCVRVLVARKYPRGRIAPDDRIPASIEGIPTDVVAVGYPRKFVLPNRMRRRPLPGGVSAGPAPDAAGRRYAGTLGVVVAGRRGRARFALSNNHVFADENRLAPGAAIVQPAALDGGTERDRAGALAAYEPLRFDNQRNWMDAAVAALDAGAPVSPEILGIGPLRGAAAPSLNLLVRKAGRTTGLTEGIVRDLRLDVFNISYDQGLVRMDDVMGIEAVGGMFSRPGDSGSAIVDAQGRVVGLLFAGSDVVTFAIPIRRVLRRFRIRIAT